MSYEFSRSNVPEGFGAMSEFEDVFWQLRRNKKVSLAVLEQTIKRIAQPLISSSMSRPVLNRVENGHLPSKWTVHHVMILAEALQCSQKEYAVLLAAFYCSIIRRKVLSGLEEPPI